MPAEFKTIFVPSVTMPSQAGYTYYDAEVDGIQLANDVTAAIQEQIGNGFTLVDTQTLMSTKYYARTYTEGIILIFQKEK